MTMILDDDLWILVLDHLGELAKECWLADTCHILQTDFLCTGSDELVGDVHVIFQGMNRRVGDTECTLWSHATLLGPLDRRNDVAHIVQSVEDTCDVGTLLSLYLIHKGAHVVRYRIHTKSVQSAVEHVSLDTHLVERFAECAYGIVRVFTCQQVNLFEGTAVSLYTAKASHCDDNWGNFSQLILAWLELTRALPHVSINETELNFLLHYSCSFSLYSMYELNSKVQN